MLQNTEHVGTSKDVIALLLAATDKKSDVLLQINPVDQKHSTPSEQTKIILDTLDKWKIERDLIIGSVFDTTFINTEIAVVLLYPWNKYLALNFYYRLVDTMYWNCCVEQLLL